MTKPLFIFKGPIQDPPLWSIQHSLITNWVARPHNMVPWGTQCIQGDREKRTTAACARDWGVKWVLVKLQEILYSELPEDLIKSTQKIKATVQGFNREDPRAEAPLSPKCQTSHYFSLWPKERSTVPFCTWEAWSGTSYDLPKATQHLRGRTWFQSSLPNMLLRAPLESTHASMQSTLSSFRSIWLFCLIRFTLNFVAHIFKFLIWISSHFIQHFLKACHDCRVVSDRLLLNN